ncbi:Fe2+-enterobactin ABC transporter substrate-binding protein [Leucobacter musarum]|uniref:Fe2+-enterobactin ABC transporter substrate-binding protein n=1 Tax=Leucobacter musarum TaxID=1930747 RepID=UPI0006A78143|nr:Fe2+-enterobactin ABC transporter substrate-binding protein [Leucobacter musarum]
MKRTPLSIAALLTAAALTLTGCSTSASSNADTDAPAAASEGEWPRTIEHEAGSTVIPEMPENIVSTSITLTGSLLAIDAPVTATATTTPSEITDADGFFSQWADVASERGVESLYPNLEFDEEAVLAADPDLIIVSASGADSTVDQYDALSAIAPTIVLNYGDKTWQDLAAELGEATGHEDDATAVVQGFDDRVAEVADEITVPEGTANAIVWNGTENPTAFAKPGSSHADLLESLGFSIEGASDDLDTSEQARDDFAFLAVENVTSALTGEVVFLISGGDSSEADLLSTPVLATAPAIAAKQVYPLGPDSFRIDYYSASEIVDLVAADFA